MSDASVTHLKWESDRRAQSKCSTELGVAAMQDAIQTEDMYRPHELQYWS